MSTKLGYFTTIENKDKPVFSHAKDSYIAGWVCDDKGEHEQFLMFADTEITKSCEISLEGVELDKGRLYGMWQSGKHSFLLSCNINGEDKVIKLPACRIRRALHRSYNNPEDVQKRSLWYKLLNR